MDKVKKPISKKDNIFCDAVQSGRSPSMLQRPLQMGAIRSVWSYILKTITFRVAVVGMANSVLNMIMILLAPWKEAKFSTYFAHGYVLVLSIPIIS
jgi:hypothetical protein